MKKIPLLFSLILIAYSTHAQYSKVADVKAFETKLQASTQNIQTLTSDFVQTKHIDVLSEDIESSGRLVYKKQNLLRWEYSEPFDYLIVINNGKLTIKDEGSKNSFDLSGNKTFLKVNDMITQSLQGGAMLHHPDYKYELLESSSEFLLKLYPQDKKTQEFMRQIEVYFSKTDYQPKRMKMLETSGDFTNIVFKNRKLNETVSNSLFVVD